MSDLSEPSLGEKLREIIELYRDFVFKHRLRQLAIDRHIPDTLRRQFDAVAHWEGLIIEASCKVQPKLIEIIPLIQDALGPESITKLRVMLSRVEEWHPRMIDDFQRYLQELFEISDRLDALQGEPPRGKEVGKNRQDEKPPKAIARKPDFNARMIDELQRNPDAQGWSQRHWARHLGCSPTTVGKQTTFQNLEEYRLMAQAERASEKAKGRQRKPRHYGCGEKRDD